jgi:large subunit ribosomal protein L6
MSRIGKLPIDVPSNVTITIEEGNAVSVKGPKGTLSRRLSSEMQLDLAEGRLTVIRPGDDRKSRSMHGLTRTLLNNMVKGVTDGFEKQLEINGVGYRAAKDGNNLNLALGFSHPVVFPAPPGITFNVEGTNRVAVSGIDKEVVGQVAAQIRAMRPPEPYKGKGIKYAGERIRRKAGKSGKAGKK